MHLRVDIHVSFQWYPKYVHNIVVLNFLYSYIIIFWGSSDFLPILFKVTSLGHCAYACELTLKDTDELTVAPFTNMD